MVFGSTKHLPWPQEQINFGFEAKNYIQTYTSSESQPPFQPPDGSMFGDGSDFNAQHYLEWRPMKEIFLFFDNSNIFKLLTGEFKLFFNFSHSKDEFHPVTMISRSRHQIVIAPPSKLHSIVEDFKTKQRTEIFPAFSNVTKKDFDTFWSSLFGTHGNSTPEATRASVESYIMRPENETKPLLWQKYICFMIMGDPVIRNASTSVFARR